MIEKIMAKIAYMAAKIEKLRQDYRKYKADQERQAILSQMQQNGIVVYQ